MTAPTSLAETLAAHSDVTFDLGTPRQYTRHGGWNEDCVCGAALGDGGHPTPLAERHAEHLADVARAWLVTRLAEQGPDVIKAHRLYPLQGTCECGIDLNGYHDHVAHVAAALAGVLTDD